jgi:4-diphosphocytidyl-2-C-methyl-D-erythritol kinase
MPDKLILQIPAKINLSLDITGKRADGYHTLRSVFQAIGIYDTLALTKADADTPFSLTCADPAVPCDARNLVWKAAAALLGDTPKGLTAHLEKHIPSQAGMGGGSADCAAALLGIRQMLCPDVTDAELHAIAARLGADVAFFLCGGTALCEGIGDQLTPIACPGGFPERYVVMAKGTEGVSTPAGYRALDALPALPPPDTDAVLAHLADSDPMGLFSVCGNMFDAVTDLPEVQQIRKILRENGARPVLSGSGAAVFGGCRDKAHAESCAAAIRAAGIPFAAVCPLLPGGITVTAEG